MDVQMKKTPKPGGMLLKDAFEDTAKVFHKNAQKKRQDRETDHPVFGTTPERGAAAAATELFGNRSPEQNISYLVSPDGLAGRRPRPVRPEASGRRLQEYRHQRLSASYCRSARRERAGGEAARQGATPRRSEV
jgi:hypothetical protein